MTLILLRHPRPVVAPGVCYGRTDLLPETEAAATAHAAWLATIPPPSGIYTSPATRCRWPAAALAAHWGIPVWVDEKLQELDFGQWENRPWAQLSPAELDPWMADFVHQAPPGGESFAALAARAGAWLAAVKQEMLGQPEPHQQPGQPEPHIVAVTHAGVIRALRCHLLGLPLAEAFDFEIAYGEMLQIQITPD